MFSYSSSIKVCCISLLALWAVSSCSPDEVDNHTRVVGDTCAPQCNSACNVDDGCGGLCTCTDPFLCAPANMCGVDNYYFPHVVTDSSSLCRLDTGPVLGTCPSSGQTGYGQDGTIIQNPMAFIEESTGLIRDLVTNLAWEKSPSTAATTLTEAQTYCDNLTLGGLNDWRVPSLPELISITDYGQSPALNTAFFVHAGGAPNTYWSDNFAVATAAHFTWQASDGTTQASVAPATSGPMVRCVSSGSLYGANYSTPSFTTERGAWDGQFVVEASGSDDAVLDNLTGLRWTPTVRLDVSSMPVSHTWLEALDYCNNLTYAGSGNWRVPSAKEMQSIVDLRSPNATFTQPAIDPAFFLNFPTRAWVWTSTPNASAAGQAYALDFGWGLITLAPSADTAPAAPEQGYFVLCVR